MEIVASASTRELAPDHIWQELDSVRVKGKAQAVAVFTPLDARTPGGSRAGPATARAVGRSAGRLPPPGLGRGRSLLAPLLAADAEKVLYQLYAQRLASMALRPQDPNWDGATRFETK